VYNFCGKIVKGERATEKVDSLNITDPRPLLPNGPNPLFSSSSAPPSSTLAFFVFPLIATKSLPTGRTPYTVISEKINCLECLRGVIGIKKLIQFFLENDF
jgi:hypothetical protein